MRKLVLPFISVLAVIGLVSLVACNKNRETNGLKAEQPTERKSAMTKAGYTFVSISTAQPGRLDEVAKIASLPSEKMDGKVPGMLARQVGVDRERNTVIVWVTFDKKETLYDYLETEEGKKDHGEDGDMSSIATFEMYDLTPVSGRIPGLRN